MFSESCSLLIMITNWQLLLLFFTWTCFLGEGRLFIYYGHFTHLCCVGLKFHEWGALQEDWEIKCHIYACSGGVRGPFPGNKLPLPVRSYGWIFIGDVMRMRMWQLSHYALLKMIKLWIQNIGHYYFIKYCWIMLWPCSVLWLVQPAQQVGASLS